MAEISDFELAVERPNRPLIGRCVPEVSRGIQAPHGVSCPIRVTRRRRFWIWILGSTVALVAICLFVAAVGRVPGPASGLSGADDQRSEATADSVRSRRRSPPKWPAPLHAYAGPDAAAPLVPEAYDAEALCDTVARVTCAHQRRCFGVPFAACVEVKRLRCLENHTGVGRALEDGTLVYDGAAAQECLNQLAADVECRESDCAPVYRGTQPLGAECRGVGLDECATGYCRFDGTCPGRCASWVEVGGRCDALEDLRCGVDSLCRNSECRARSERGGPCRDAFECASGLMCSAAQCVARRSLPSGAVCSDSHVCAFGLYCKTYLTVGRCVAASGVGEPCTGTIQCHPPLRCLGNDGDKGSSVRTCEVLRPEESPCLDGSECDTGLCVDGACIARPLEGEWCNDERPCQSGFSRCVNGRCEPIPSEEPCVDGDQCLAARWHCERGVCVPPGRGFEPCESSMQCASLQCQDGRCTPSLAYCPLGDAAPKNPWAF